MVLNGGVIADSAGNLYGVTYFGGDGTTGQANSGNGTVYELSPPSAGATKWTERILYRFKPKHDGSTPSGALVMDSTGALYGATFCGGLGVTSSYCGNGIIFKLTPTGTSWTETILYQFTDGADGATPGGSLVFDSSGALYGVTDPALYDGLYPGKGAVFKMSPPQLGATAWSFSELYQFGGGTDGANPSAGLIFDGAGNLYGATLSGGGEDCALFTAKVCGTVFQLSPPQTGQTAWTETVLWHFLSGSDGDTPNAPLVFDSSGALYGTTSVGGSGTGACNQGGRQEGTNNPVGCGTAFKLTPPSSGQTSWSKQTIRSFNGYPTDAYSPSALSFGPDGVLYGASIAGGPGGCSTYTPIGCGVAFSLTPPTNGGSAWKEKILVKFQNGKTGLDPFSLAVVGAAGSPVTLFSTIQLVGQPYDTNGAVIEITP